MYFEKSNKRLITLRNPFKTALNQKGRGKKKNERRKREHKFSAFKNKRDDITTHPAHCNRGDYK